MASWELSESAAKLAAFGASAASPYATMLGQSASNEVPTAPMVTVGTISTNSIAITWTAATAPTDAPVQGYEMWIQQGTGTPSNVTDLAATARSYTFTGLASGQSYTVWVAAFNRVGTGPASNKPTRTTTGGQVPSAPTNLRVSTAATNTTVGLSWDPATTPTGTTITGYKVYGGPTTVTVTGLTASLTNLTAGSAYSFTVRATNVNGEGPASNALPVSTTGASTGALVIYAAGDIAHASYLPDSQRTSDLIMSRTDKDMVIAMGDLAYSAGSLANYNQYYNPSWGRFKAITEPVPGNHEYKTTNAQGYRDYWGSRVVGPNNMLYRSLLRSSWMFLFMDSGDAQTSTATSGIETAQVAWAEQQLIANKGKYTGILATWHHPRFSSGNDGNNTDTSAMVEMLRKYNADIVLVGHDHNYERFKKLNAAGTALDPGGIAHFTCGTGGGSLRSTGVKKFGSDAYWGSGGDWSKGRRNGVVRFELSPTQYKWQWIDCSNPPGLASEVDTGTMPVNPK